MKRIYLDNAATTSVSNEVLNEMMPVFNIIYGNSSSLHSFGQEALALVDKARERVSKLINCKPDEIYFTAGGTEANNLAIKGIAYANRSKGNHIITSKIEHDSVLESCKQLEKEGFEVTYLDCDEYGVVSLADLLHNIKDTTILVSIMSVNNEVGTVQNIKAIAKTCKDYGVIFHTDAVQAIGHIGIDVKDMDIDALSMSAHKINGPKGCGAVYIKNGIKFNPVIIGGNQEKRKRGGTLNTPSIVGFGKACEIVSRDMLVNNQKIRKIRDYFLKCLQEKVEDYKVNGHQYQKVNNIVNISFNFIEGESILMLLDLQGIAVSTGSACTSGTLEPSHVLRAMGIKDEIAQGSIRFSFSKNISKEDIDYITDKVAEVVKKLRAISPLTKAGRSKKNV